VYLYFLGPEDLKGTETIYVAGRNEGKLVAHAGSGVQAVIGAVNLDPNGRIAMKGNRYPITELGVRNLTSRLIEVGTADSQFGECEVKTFQGAKINGRTCNCLQVVHPVPRKNFRYHVARIFNDDELNVPIRFESYDWPKRAGEKPELIEEYTYMNLKTNVGLTDADFDQKNPNYKF
jgi:hypothetical protein